MTRSDQINELAAALAKAQADMTGARKDSTNPHFRSSYADLASVREASVPALNKHGIAVVQFPRLIHAGEDAWLVEVETQLVHTSGQFMADTLAVPIPKVDAQGVGSAITYARRYALGAISSVAPEDDDGEAAVGRADQSKQAAPNGAMTTVVVKVLGIVKKQAGNGFKFVVTGDDQKTYATFKEPIAQKAKDAHEAGVPIAITFKRGQYGNDIVELAEAVPEPAL